MDVVLIDDVFEIINTMQIEIQQELNLIDDVFEIINTMQIEIQQELNKQGFTFGTFAKLTLGKRHGLDCLVMEMQALINRDC